MSLHRAASVLAGCIALGSLSGCQLASFIALCDEGEPQCSAYFYASGLQFPDEALPTSDENGCIATSVFLGCDDPGATYCGLTPNTAYSAINLCSDPVLAQWPDEWTVTGATWYTAFPPPVSGAVIIEPAENLQLPDGVGSIVTDPGHSAYVLRMDLMEIPEDLYVIRIDFDRGELLHACPKGVEVSMATFEPGNVRFISPLPGESLDLTTYSAPDPHVVCVDTPTPVRPSSWGWIKSTYRRVVGP